MNKIYKKLHELMQSKNISFRILEEKTGIPKSAIQRYVSGETTNIPIDRLQILAKALNVSPEMILGWANKGDIIEDIFTNLIEILDIRFSLQRINFYFLLKSICIYKGSDLFELFYSYYDYLKFYIENNEYKLPFTYSFHNILLRFRDFFVGGIELSDEEIRYFIFSQARFSFDIDEKFSRDESLQDSGFIYTLDDVISKCDNKEYGSILPIDLLIDYERDIYLMKTSKISNKNLINSSLDKIRLLQIELDDYGVEKFEFSFVDFINLKFPKNGFPKNDILSSVIQVYSHIPSGIPFEEIETFLEEIEIPNWLSKKRDLFGLKIVGDSMNKVLPNGCIAVLQKISILENGDIGLILVNENDATLKKFYNLTDSIVLEPRSYNPEHKPIILKNGQETFLPIAKLLWYCASREFLNEK